MGKEPTYVHRCQYIHSLLIRKRMHKIDVTIVKAKFEEMS